MSWIAKTLWDLLSGASIQRPGQPTPSQPLAASRQAPAKPGLRPAKKSSMQQRYDALVVEMKRAYGIRVRKWRSSSSGCAWEVRYDNGNIRRLIEAPYPRGPMSCAIFLHEIGHHAIGFKTYKPRCLEEYFAWKWSLDTMAERGFNVTEAVQKRMEESLRYAIAKARRRGLRQLPAELLPYA